MKEKEKNKDKKERKEKNGFFDDDNDVQFISLESLIEKDMEKFSAEFTLLHATFSDDEY
jgi:hypothetical protein